MDYTLLSQKGGKGPLWGNIGPKQDWNLTRQTQLYSHMSNIQKFRWVFRFSTPPSFAGCNTFLSWVSYSVCSSPWQKSHSSGVSDMLAFPKQSKLHAMITPSLHVESPLPHISILFLTTWKDSTTSLILCLSWQSQNQLLSFPTYWGWKLGPSLNYICLSFHLLMLFRWKKFLSGVFSFYVLQIKWVCCSEGITQFISFSNRSCFNLLIP